jgi:hypothetical protein
MICELQQLNVTFRVSNIITPPMLTVQGVLAVGDSTWHAMLRTTNGAPLVSSGRPDDNLYLSRSYTPQPARSMASPFPHP